MDSIQYFYYNRNKDITFYVDFLVLVISAARLCVIKVGNMYSIICPGVSSGHLLTSPDKLGGFQFVDKLIYENVNLRMSFSFTAYSSSCIL